MEKSYVLFIPSGLIFEKFIDAGKALRSLIRSGLKGTVFLPLDNLGRSQGIRAKITPSMIGTGSPATAQPLGIDEAEGLSSGHLLGNQLGGPGNDKRNLAPIYQVNVNNSAMLRIENEVRRRVQAGEVIDYFVAPIYKGNDLVPVGITISAKGSKGFTLNTSLVNQPGRGPGPDFGF